MIDPAQCRAARAWLNWSQEHLAQEAKVSLSTIRDFESETREPIANNIEAIEAAFKNVGMEFKSGPLESMGMVYEGRIKESDTYIPILEFLRDSPNGFLTTAQAIKLLTEKFDPQGEDIKILRNRSDTKFSQIVRNIVSHKQDTRNLIGAGYAEHDKRLKGLRITQKGQEHLDAEKKRRKSEP